MPHHDIEIQKLLKYLCSVAGLLFSSTHLSDCEILFKDDFHVVPNSWVRDIMKCLREVGLLVLLVSGVQNKTRDFLRACRSSWGGVSVFITCAVNYGEHGLVRFENAKRYLF